MEKKNPTAKEIWDTLSQVNVNEHTEERGGLTYLSWAWAWGVMMDHYPDLVIYWHGQKDASGVMRDVTTYEGGSASVNVTVTIGDVSREMWLPVMDYRHKAIAHPDARSISDCKMRCLVKCFALFGLGHYIYSSEDLPPKTSDTVKESKPKKETPKKETPKKATPKKSPKKSPKKTVEEATEETLIDGWVEDLKAMIMDLNERGWTPPDQDMRNEIKDAIKNRDGEKLVKLNKVIKKMGEIALKLHIEKEEEK